MKFQVLNDGALGIAVLLGAQSESHGSIRLALYYFGLFSSQPQPFLCVGTSGTQRDSYVKHYHPPLTSREFVSKLDADAYR